MTFEETIEHIDQAIAQLYEAQTSIALASASNDATVTPEDVAADVQVVVRRDLELCAQAIKLQIAALNTRLRTLHAQNRRIQAAAVAARAALSRTVDGTETS